MEIRAVFHGRGQARQVWFFKGGLAMTQIVIPNIPIPSAKSGVDRAWQSAVKELLDVRSGLRPAAGAMTWVTKGALDEALMRIVSGKTTIPGASAPAIPTGKPVPPPRNIRVDQGDLGAFSIRLRWDNSQNSRVAATEVWSSETSSRSDAIRLAVVPVPSASHVFIPLRVAANHWFWVRHVGHGGVDASTWEPGETMGGFLVEGSATIAETIDQVLAILMDPLFESDLYKGLSAQIADISQGVLLLGEQIVSTAAGLNEELAARIVATQDVANQVVSMGLTLDLSMQGLEEDLQAIFNQVNGLSGTLNTHVQGLRDDVADVLSMSQKNMESVADLGNFILSIGGQIVATETGIRQERLERQTDTESLAQQIITMGATLGNDIAAAIQQEQTARATQDEALAQQLVTIGAVVSGNTAAIQQEQTTRATQDEALAQQILLLGGQTVNTSAAINVEMVARATQDEALAQQILTMGATLGDSVSAAIQQEQTARVNADEALAQTISTWVATFDGETLAAIRDEISVISTETDALAQRITNLVADFEGDTLGAIHTSLATLANADEALARQVLLLGGQMVNTSAVVNAETVSRVTATEALAQQILTMGATLGNDIAAAIQQEQTARATQDEALAQQVTTLGAVLGDNFYSIIQEEQQARASADEILAQQVLLIGGQTVTTATAINEETVIRATQDEALAQQILTMGATLGNDIAAAIQQEQTTRANADSALAQDVSLVGSFVGDAVSLLLAELSSRVTATGAIAEYIQTIQTSLNGNVASVQQLMSSVDGLSGKYTVKVDVNGYVSGFGLASSANNGSPTSEFILLVDKFKVVTPGKNPVVPFAVGNVNGVSTVGVNGQMVIDGSILARSIQTDGLQVGTNISVKNGAIAIGRVGAAGPVAWQNATQMAGKPAGLYLTDQYMGFFDGSSWDTSTWFKADGSVQLAGSGAGLLIKSENTEGRKVEITDADITFFYNAGEGQIPYKSLRRFEFGEGSNGVEITIPGIFSKAPKVFVFPKRLQSYKASHSGGDQEQVFSADNLTHAGGGVYTFTPKVELTTAGYSVAATHSSASIYAYRCVGTSCSMADDLSGNHFAFSSPVNDFLISFNARVYLRTSLGGAYRYHSASANVSIRIDSHDGASWSTRASKTIEVNSSVSGIYNIPPWGAFSIQGADTRNVYHTRVVITGVSVTSHYTDGLLLEISFSNITGSKSGATSLATGTVFYVAIE